MPPTSYSRVEIAVVSGAVTRCVSSLADMVSVHPSGACVVFGGDDSTPPASTGAACGGGGAAWAGCASAETASTSGSADATGAANTQVNTQALSSAKGRTSTTQPSSAEAHTTWDHYPTTTARATRRPGGARVFIRV